MDTLVEQPILQGDQGLLPVQLGGDGGALEDVGGGLVRRITTWAPGVVLVQPAQHDLSHTTVTRTVLAEPMSLAQGFLLDCLVEGFPIHTLVDQLRRNGVVFLLGPVLLGLLSVDLLVEVGFEDPGLLPSLKVNLNLFSWKGNVGGRPGRVVAWRLHPSGR